MARSRRGLLSLALAPVMAAGTSLMPVTVIAVGVTAATVAAVATAKPARAATPTVLILSTSVNGGSSSAEAQAASAAGGTVTIATPATWDAMTTAQFKAYSAVVIGDPSASGSCASTVPSDALSTAATWGAAVTGNVSVLGTAPALAGTSGSALIADGIAFALAGSGTGLYVSLNCEYSSAAAGTAVPLLAHLDGGGFTVTGQHASCPSNSGTVNTWQAVANLQYHGLGTAIGPWSSPACAVQETFTAWPAGLGGLAYDKAATPATFTASDGASAGQAYLLAGAVPSAATAALAPSTGGEVPAGTTAGGAGNPAAPGVSQASSGDPVNTENGDFSQSSTDLSIPTFGPSLDFTRTYDALLAQQQTQTGTPGAMGYGWTDSLASSLTTTRPVPGDIYTIDGLATNNGDGGPATSAVLNSSAGDWSDSTGLYIADTNGNRIQEVAATTGTQWGIAMTAGDVYTIAGSPTGVAGISPNGTPAASALLNTPASVLVSSGNLYIADSGNNRVLEIPGTSGTQHGVSMTAGDSYTIAGHADGTSGISGDNGAAISAFLSGPQAIAVGAGTSDIYIADSFNDRIQEVPAATGSQWGISMTANDMYTIAGDAAGSTGTSGDGGKATSALLFQPMGLRLSSSGDLYIADTFNNRIQEVPKASGNQWGISMTANDMYTVAGDAAGNLGTSGDGGKATSALLSSPNDVEVTNGNQLYVTDFGNQRVQEVARSTHTEWGISMTANDVYTIAGSASGAQGFSGDGGKATSALLDSPYAVTLDSSLNMYITDSGNNRVRKVSAQTGNIATFAGNGSTLRNEGNGGPALTAAVFNPDEVATDSLGDVFIADALNDRVQEIAATSHTQFNIAMTAGDVYTVVGDPLGFAGSDGDGGPSTQAQLNTPIGLATDAAGDLFIGDSNNNRVQKVNASTGIISTVAGDASGQLSGSSGDGGPATSALLSSPWGLAVDKFGDLYIADQGNSRIQEVFASGGEHWGQAMTPGDIYTVAGSAAGTFGNSGNGGKATSALLGNPGGVTVDGAGNLYIADSVNEEIREVAATTGSHWGQQMTANDIYSVAGSATVGNTGTSGDGGPATAALLNDPIAVTSDAAGDLFIADSFNDRVQEIAAADGTQWGQSMTAGFIYTVAGHADGTGGDSSGDGGPATSAILNIPFGIAVDPGGDLFLTDESGNLIREVTSTTATVIQPASGQTSWLSPAPGGITVTQPDGAAVTFFAQSGGNCAAPYVKAGGYCALPQDMSATLTFHSGNSTYTFSPSPGTTYTYTSNGVLTGEADAAGDTLTVTYGTPTPGSGNCPASAFACDTVTSASGRALTLGINSAGLVTSATDPMGRTWTYGYTGSDLTKATDPMGNVTTYTYGAGSTGNPLNANNLLTMTSPNAQPGGPDAGDSTVNGYDATGRVTSQTDPMGFKTTFNYCVNAATGNCMNTATGTGYVTVTDPDGNTTVYGYQQGTQTAQSSWTAGTTLASEQDFVPAQAATGANAGTQLDVLSTDGNGNITTTAFDAAGNPTASTAPDGLGSLQGTITAQFTNLNQPSCAADAQAASQCSASQTGPSPVAPGGAITPPSSAPPAGVTYILYDTNGHALYTTTGVFQPGSSTASYAQTNYTLYKGNNVTINGNQVSCTLTPPSASRPCATINADGVVTQLSYDAQGDLTSSATSDGNGSEIATTTFGYNGDGEQTSKVTPDGNVSGANAANFTTVTSYNNDGLRSVVTLAGGSGATVTPRTTNYGYDANGNLTTAQDARGFTTTTTYNAADKKTLVVDPLGNATLSCYDGAGNLTQTVPPTGVAANSLTPSSCPTSYPSGYGSRLASDATTRTFDAEGHQTAVTAPAPAGQSGSETTSYSYDGDGHVLTTTAPPASGTTSQVTTNTYNAAGRLASQTTGSGTSAASTTTYCYDPNGDTTSVVMPDGNASGSGSCETSSPWVVSSNAFPTQAAYQSTYSYDSAGEVVAATSPATAAAPSGATTNYTYDAAGNVLTSTDPKGVTTTKTYTPMSLVATVSYSGSSAHSVSYSYDANGNRTAMSDGTGSSSYGYDPFGELTSDKNGASQTTGYSYDADGDITGITYPLPSTATWATTDTVGYGYNHADVLTSITDFNGNQIAITPNADSLPSSLALGSSGDTISYSYDPAGNPSAIALKNSTSTLQSFSYSMAPAGNITRETDTPSSPNTPAVYTYSAKAQVNSMTPGTNATLSYAFDPSGNLTTLPTGATSSYDNAGELTSSALSGTTTTYTYNADGQRLSAARGGTTVVAASWNGAGQLTSYDNNAADMSAASYNGDGLRQSATTGGNAQSFDWDLATPIPQLLMDSASAYIFTAGLGPSEQVNLSTGKVTYLVCDRLGSIRGVVSSSGSLTATTSYDAFGNPLTSGGLSSSTPFGFAGAYTDPTGLIYLVNRYYDPATGQFISVDPAIAQTLQPFEYAAGNPVSYTDPNGLRPSIHFFWSHVEILWDLGETFLIYFASETITKMTDFIKKYLEPFGIGLYLQILVHILHHYVTYIHHIAAIALDDTENPELPGLYCTGWNIYWWATFVVFVYRCG